MGVEFDRRMSPLNLAIFNYFLLLSSSEGPKMTSVWLLRLRRCTHVAFVVVWVVVWVLHWMTQKLGLNGTQMMNTFLSGTK